ncbi:hypothetical protein VP1G_05433 [Cytospora mali]|uniref:Uncharacterized protein n=1 Tax=Cytospora mali TaxID=578113 RepID=A0A194V2I4_CYTMA|nr:hypothetical protein VP1G_05433 [Valsa mali var. pyri (nom. inval.)]
MEPPTKRQRVGLGSTATQEDEDELDFDPKELNQRRDPAFQLEQARDRAAYKLKSRFENIFAKYERDFTGVGDEIDLRTGQVVVDNGHLESMRSVKDTGDGEEDDEDSEQEEERIMHGEKVAGSIPSDAVMRKDPWAVAGASLNRSSLSPMMGGPPRLSSMMFTGGNAFMTPPRSFDSFDSGASLSLDPTWQAPDLPRSAFLGNSFGGPGRQYGFGMGASAKKVIRSTLTAPRDRDEEDEDVLLGVSGNVPKQKEPVKESPLIKEKFPTVDSSPHNDSGLNQLIQEVIENIPETPPSVQKPIASKTGTLRQLSARKMPTQPKVETKKRPRGRPRKDTGENHKMGSNGATLDVSKEDVSAESPTESIKARRNDRPLAGRAGTIAQANGPGQKNSSFQEGDLEVYQDVTGMPIDKSRGQALYVNIESRNIKRNGPQDWPHAKMAHKKSIGPGKQHAKPPTVQEKFEKNVIDPTFTFSDEETLPPRTAGKHRRKSEPAKPDALQVLQASQPNLQRLPIDKRLFERNIVDPSYAFSDEDNLLPRRAKTTKRQPKSAVRAKLSPEGDSSARRQSDDGRVSEPKGTHNVPSKRKGRRQSTHSAHKPDAAVDTPVDGTAGSVASNALPAEISVHEEQSVDQAAESSNSVLCPTVKRRPGRPRRPGVERVASPELGEFTIPDADADTPEVGHDKARTEETLPAAAIHAPPQQPTTPQSKSKAADRTTPSSSSSSKPGLISLLSDTEDEEDEISFDLSAFTPSGHHRILAHRSQHPHNTSPHMSTNSTASKKKRASGLLFGPSSTSKIRTHRTPGSKGKEGKGERRDSTNSLARSVVKVRRESFRAPSPAGSVVQTPGGTKRRCGEDGFRCDRDFCFVCISI